MRLIDADALIEDVDGDLTDSIAEGRAIEKIMNAPTIEPEPQWIPCSERLPEEYGEYRITWTTSCSKKRFIGDSEYEVTGEWDVEHGRFKGEWLLEDYIKYYPDVKVIAWKPIEEPYAERKTDEKENI